MRNYEESRLQAEIVKSLSLLGIYVIMCPNGEITDMSAKKYQRLAAQGFRTGAPDLFLFGEGHNLFYCLELKRPGGKQSEGQIKFQSKCQKENWPYAAIDSLDDAIAQAREWGLIKNV